MGISSLTSCLPGMWQVPRVGNRRLFLTIIPGTNTSSYYCTGCDPVTVPPFLFNSHNTLKVDTYYVYFTNEATNSEVKRLARVTPLRLKPRPHWASKSCLTTRHHFVQCLCDLGFKINCSFFSLWLQKHRPWRTTLKQHLLWDVTILEFYLGLWTAVKLY